MPSEKIKIIECPRDAIQGWPHPISTTQKITYINSLLEAGFDSIDFGSFVSPKAIPQMADTTEVLSGLDPTPSHLLAIVANTRGAQEALLHDRIGYLGFPFSVSETFQLRNTNATIAASLERVAEIQELCLKNRKSLVVYISMGFGNPYGDPFSEALVLEWVQQLVDLGINIISMADTVGVATPQQVSSVVSKLIQTYPAIETGVHLHSTPGLRKEKINAALEAGCHRFDGALRGIGGCPMAGNDLVGNMDTEFMVAHFEELGYATGINKQALAKSSALAASVFV